METIFDLWPSAADLARELGEKDVTVRAWKARGRIPADRDLRIVSAARGRGYALTTDHLARIRAGQTDVVIPATDCNGEAARGAAQ